MIAAGLLWMPLLGHAQSPLEVFALDDELTLTWPDGNRLFSSTDLITWEEVVGATSPLLRSIDQSLGAEFFALSVEDLATDLPLNNSVVGTQSIPVTGNVSNKLSGTEGLSVTVNGQLAQVISSPTGADRFIIDGLPLSVGLNTLNVLVTNTAGDSENLTLQVTYDPIIANNVVVRGNFAYAAMGSSGMAIVNLTTRARTLVNSSGSNSDIHDLSIDGDLLFTLDATNTGGLSVYSLADPALPTLVSGPVSVAVNPFAGVSAAEGRVVVSGGTSLLTLRNYDQDSGALSSAVSSIDLGVGQPDVLVSADGESAFVSTDFLGSFDGSGFGITVLSLNTPLTTPPEEDRIGLAGINFSNIQAPANFPIESAEIDGVLLVAHRAGLAVINIETGDLIRVVDLGFFAANVDVSGDRAFVVGSEGGSVSRLTELDITSPSNPIILETQSSLTQTFFPVSPFSGVAASDDFVVIAGNGSGLQIIAR